MQHPLVRPGLVLGLLAPGALAAQSGPGAVAAADRWEVDAAHSAVGFRVRHLGITWVNGSFREWTADLRFDPANPGAASVTARIKTASVTTGNPRRDGDLRANYFAADSFPEIAFTSTSVRTEGAGRLRIAGNLSMRGVTRPVVLDAEIGGVVTGSRGTRAAFTAATSISRRDFGMLRNPVIEGVNLVGDDVRITIDIEVALSSP